jgi:hypothetical protein
MLTAAAAANSSSILFPVIVVFRMRSVQGQLFDHSSDLALVGLDGQPAMSWYDDAGFFAVFSEA